MRFDPVLLLRARWPLGESLPMIAKRLGHTQVQTTARYTHLTRDFVTASAASIAADILSGASGLGNGG